MTHNINSCLPKSYGEFTPAYDINTSAPNTKSAPVKNPAATGAKAYSPKTNKVIFHLNTF